MPDFSKLETAFMREAIRLAKKGMGLVHPNPLVGAVITSKDQIIAKGFHQKFGGPHAEIHAIKKCQQSLKKSTLYVTLEPCVTTGKTPPCVDAIIQSGIRKVVIADKDSYLKNRGYGVQKLKKHHIHVRLGLLADPAHQMNRAFHYYMKHKLPYVTCKMAMSLDGKIASKNRTAEKISSDQSLGRVQRIRQEVDGIVVGVGTVIQDNPRLNVRIKTNHQPCKIIFDSTGRIPLSCQILKDLSSDVIVMTTSLMSKTKSRQLEKMGARVIQCQSDQHKINIQDALFKMGEMGLIHLLLEGGGELAYSFLYQKMIQEIFMFVAPKIIGGKFSPTPFDGAGVESVLDAYRLQQMKVSKIGSDLLIHGVLR